MNQKRDLEKYQIQMKINQIEIVIDWHLVIVLNKVRKLLTPNQ